MKTADLACLIFYHPVKVGDDGKVEFHSEVVKVSTNKENGKNLFLDAVEVLLGGEPECSKDCCWCNWGR